MFSSRPITWASLIFLGLAFWLHYSYPAAKDMAAEPSKSIYDFTVKWFNAVTLQGVEHFVREVQRSRQYRTVSCGVSMLCVSVSGFEILAFPCNQFASQEPGTNEEIQETIDVNGKNTAPLYKFLKSEKGGVLVDAIKWNFTKFLVNKEGKVVHRYAPTTSPLAIEVERLLHFLFL
ncbi:UNVERIFIED_CONTAM: putative glutathione peroxidase 2 [Sesamum radiatum]|uniref:Glutathione peroxidase 2 n=1 Tax=Sesamum radiatum TaxID=300843 RepID=A0AAW2L277_SESRA